MNRIGGAHRDWLVERCREWGFRLRELVAEFAERSLKVDTARSGSSFTPRSSITKRRRSRPSRTAPTWRGDAPNGRAATARRSRPPRLHRRDPGSSPGAGSGPRPTWPRSGAGRPAASASTPKVPPPEDHDLPCPYAMTASPINGEKLPGSTLRRSWSRASAQATSRSSTTSGSHRGKAVRRAIRAAGARLFSCPNTPRPQPHRATLRQA